MADLSTITKRFPSSRCASVIQIVRPLESTAETQPQLQPALNRLSYRGKRPKNSLNNSRTFAGSEIRKLDSHRILPLLRPSKESQLKRQSGSRRRSQMEPFSSKGLYRGKEAFF